MFDFSTAQVLFENIERNWKDVTEGKCELVYGEEHYGGEGVITKWVPWYRLFAVKHHVWPARGALHGYGADGVELMRRAIDIQTPADVVILLLNWTISVNGRVTLSNYKPDTLHRLCMLKRVDIQNYRQPSGDEMVAATPVLAAVAKTLPWPAINTKPSWRHPTGLLDDCFLTNIAKSAVPMYEKAIAAYAEIDPLHGLVINTSAVLDSYGVAKLMWYSERTGKSLEGFWDIVESLENPKPT